MCAVASIHRQELRHSIGAAPVMIALTDHYSYGLLWLGQGGKLLSGVIEMAH